MKIGSLIMCGKEEVKLGQHIQSLPKTPRRQCRISQISGKFLISLFRVRPIPTPALWLSLQKLSAWSWQERNFRLKLSKGCLPKYSVFCHLCNRHFKPVFEGAVWVLGQKPYRKWEVILHKDILSSAEEQQKLPHQQPELARAVSWKAFSLRRNFKNCMQGISWAWPLFPIFCKSPVCHQAHAGAAVCWWGALTLKRFHLRPLPLCKCKEGWGFLLLRLAKSGHLTAA